MTATRKRWKTEDEANSREEVSQMDEGRLNLTFDIVIRTLKCPRLLRICRLVCKSWNISACSVLSLEPICFEPEESDSDSPDTIDTRTRTDKFQENLTMRKSHGLNFEDVPSPFKKLSAKILEDEDYMQVEKYLSSDIVLTELILEGTVGQENLEKLVIPFLIANAESLTTLTISNFRDFPVPANSMEIGKLKLLNLRSLSISADGGELDKPSYYKKFMTNILGDSKLEDLELHVDVSYSLVSLKELNMESVSAVHLNITHSERQITETVSSLMKYPLPNLKVLDTSGAMPSQLIVTLISSFVTTIEELTVPFINLELLPVCPKVKEITCKLDRQSKFLAEKFPSLKKVFSSTPHKIIKNSIPHFGVEYLYVNVLEIDLHEDNSILMDRNEEVCSFCLEIEILVETSSATEEFFYKNKGRFCYLKRIMKMIRNSFPSLKSLNLGLNWELKGYPIPRIHRSMFELKDCPDPSLLATIFPLQDFRRTVLSCLKYVFEN